MTAESEDGGPVEQIDAEVVREKLDKMQEQLDRIEGHLEALVAEIGGSE